MKNYVDNNLRENEKCPLHVTLRNRNSHRESKIQTRRILKTFIAFDLFFFFFFFFFFFLPVSGMTNRKYTLDLTTHCHRSDYS